MDTKTVTLTTDEWFRILVSLFYERHATTGEEIPINKEIIRKIQKQTEMWGIAG